MKPLLHALIFMVSTISLATEPALGFDHQHLQWDSIVKNNVVWEGSTSSVNYQSIKKNPDTLSHYLESLSQVRLAEFNIWTPKEQLAFLINAYNAWTIKLILENYPLQSIKNIGGLFSNPWKKKFISMFGKQISLDEIEHEKIRPIYKEPRVHFALVCASKGCPGLRSEAFTAKKLDDQMEDATKLFLRDSTRNRLNTEKKILQISLIFKWYKEDFVQSKGSIGGFVLPYLINEQKQVSALNNKLKIEFLDYDWSLNER